MGDIKNYSKYIDRKIMPKLTIKKTEEYSFRNLYDNLDSILTKNEEYIEFEREIRNPIIRIFNFNNMFNLNWKKSNRNPLIFKKIEILNDCVGLFFKSNSSGGGSKYIYLGNEISFFNHGFYYGIGLINDKNQFQLYHQNIYLNKKIFDEKILNL